MPFTSSPWPLLSDILEGKKRCKKFSATDKAIFLVLANETIRILFTDLNLESLEGLVRYYQDNPDISHSHGTNHAEHCASYVTSIIAHATQEQWGEFDLMNKWRTSNQEGYAKCIEFVLKNGSAQSISLLVNAVKGAITLMRSKALLP